MCEEDYEDEYEGLFMVFKKCKCGQDVGCIAGDGTKDGDLIEHDCCKLKQKAGDL